jgi:hypothetical protein
VIGIARNCSGLLAGLVVPRRVRGAMRPPSGGKKGEKPANPADGGFGGG